MNTTPHQEISDAMIGTANTTTCTTIADEMLNSTQMDLFLAETRASENNNQGH